MKTFVMGDIHGNYKGLLQCLERSNFNKKVDCLVQLGDIVDGYANEAMECVEELSSINRLILIKGNHDIWFNEFLTTGFHSVNWLQGGNTTRESFNRNSSSFKKIDGFKNYIDYLIHFFNKQLLYYIDERNRFFVHGGFNRHEYVSNTKLINPSIFYWDRDFFNSALSFNSMKVVEYKQLEEGDYSIKGKFKIQDNFKEVYLGHTATNNWLHKEKLSENGIIISKGDPITTPIKLINDTIINMDTGSGYSGKLSIMDIDTKEYWQSDLVSDLYKY